MRFLIVNTDYPAFLASLYSQHEGLAERPYAEQLRTRNQTLFGVSDSYPRNLNALGHEAHEVHINNLYLQRAWAREQGLRVWTRWPWPFRPRLRSWTPPAPWFYRILAAQIEHYRPDVVLSYAIGEISSAFWKRMKRQYGLLVAQIAAPIAPTADLSPFGLMLSSLPNFVEDFRQQGLRAELFRLGFDPMVLDRVPEVLRDTDVSFVGNLTADHGGRVQWLEHLCRQFEVKVWGLIATDLPADSAIRRAHQGEAWGADMYRVLRRSRITLNYHIGISANYANNMRLYEATGMGAMLVTDWKQNLPDLFEPGRDIIAYRSVEDCARQVRHYLDHDDQRQNVAQAGQARTLRDHNYGGRMQELVGIVERYA